MGIHGRITWKLALVTLITAGSLSAVASEEFESVPGEYIVKLRTSVEATNKTTLGQILGSYVKSTIPSGNLVVIKRPAFEIQSSVIKTLSENPSVEIVEPNFIYRLDRTANDPLMGKLWGLKNFGQDDKAPGILGIDVDAERAWDITTGSDNVIVAVIDTGIDYNHPDLKDNMWINQAEANGQPGVDDDGNGYVDDVYGQNFVEDVTTPDPLDDHGHGSHCSGTIGARGNDGKGIVGVAWNVKFMALKFLSAQGSGSLEGAIKAIDYATQNGAKIMSNSWGGGGYSETLKEAIERANDAGVLFVAAAGNNGTNNDDKPHYPSNYEVANVLSVAAIDNKGALASFSNYGKKTVHVAAPGVNIYSSINGGSYDSWSGTSMATPHVTGVAVLLAANEPNLTNLELKNRIIATAKPLSTIKNKTKAGLANAYLALTNQVAPPDANDPSNWAAKTVSVSSPHPYKKSSNETYELSVPGAKEIALYFSKFDSEKTYDKATLFDKAGTKIGEISGNNDDTYSPVVTGDYVKVVFTSDESVEKYGFDITKIAHR